MPVSWHGVNIGAHVAISTNLVNVSRVAMIKSSIRCAASTVNLVSQSLRRGLVDVVTTRNVVHVKERVTKSDVVDRVTVIVKQNIAVEARIQYNIGMLLDVCRVLVVVSTIVSEFHAG